MALEPIDLRWGFDRLCSVAGERTGRDGRSGALFVFLGRRRTAVKVLFFDGSGVCLFYKRLDQGTFRLPTPTKEDATVVEIEERALEDLLDGIDLESAPARRRPRSVKH